MNRKFSRCFGNLQCTCRYMRQNTQTKAVESHRNFDFVTTLLVSSKEVQLGFVSNYHILVCLESGHIESLTSVLVINVCLLLSNKPRKRIPLMQDRTQLSNNPHATVFTNPKAVLSKVTPFIKNILVKMPGWQSYLKVVNIPN